VAPCLENQKFCCGFAHPTQPTQTHDASTGAQRADQSHDRRSTQSTWPHSQATWLRRQSYQSHQLSPSCAFSSSFSWTFASWTSSLSGSHHRAAASIARKKQHGRKHSQSSPQSRDQWGSGFQSPVRSRAANQAAHGSGDVRLPTRNNNNARVQPTDEKLGRRTGKSLLRSRSSRLFKKKLGSALSLSLSLLPSPSSSTFPPLCEGVSVPLEAMFTNGLLGDVVARTPAPKRPISRTMARIT